MLIIYTSFSGVKLTASDQLLQKTHPCKKIAIGWAGEGSDPKTEIHMHDLQHTPTKIFINIR